MNRSAKPLRAILLPSYTWNPYQRLLASALRDDAGVEASAIHEWSGRAPLLGTWLAQGRPDVLHVQWIHDFVGGPSGKPRRREVLWFEWQLRLVKALGARVVWTVHNLKAHASRGADPREARVHRAMIERADAIIFHCQYARDALVEMYGASDAAQAHMHVIPHGNYVHQYDVDADAVAAREALGLPADGRIFVFVGSIRGYKNAGGLIEAFRRVEELGPGDRLLICGQPLPAKLGKDLAQAAAGDERIVLRLERIPEEELSRILRGSDVAVMPFRDILTSGSVILALSHGRPVIAPARGCLPETMPSDASFLYDPDHPDALSDAIRDAAASDLAAMGRRARAFADTIEWGPIAEETAALYRG